MIPFPSLSLRHAAIIAGVMAALFVLWRWGESREADGRAAVQAEWDEAKAEQFAALRAEEKREIHIERAGQDIVSKEVHRAREEDPRAAAAAADLRNARERVQQRAEQLAAATAAAGQAPGSAGGSAATAGAGLVLANLYRGADAEAAELAQAFDEARARGLRCERISDELRALFTDPDRAGPATTPDHKE